MSKKLDYLPINKERKTRPQLTIYELSGIITSLAQNIFDAKSLKEFVKDDSEINGVVNPSDIAFHLLKNGEFDAIINRKSENIHFSQLYVNPMHYELLENYFLKQRKTVDRKINSKFGVTADSD
jgi:hypothetical protein